MLLRLTREQRAKVRKVPIINVLLLSSMQTVTYTLINHPPCLWSLISHYKNLKVLVDGLHDPESKLNMLRWPNDVRSPVMEKIWDLVTGDWQAFSNHPLHHY